MLVALGLLVFTLVVGVVAHELSHAIALRAFSIRHEIRLLPDRSQSRGLRAVIGGRWASVDLRDVPADAANWKLRVAALMPLTLVIPFGLIPLGVLPDPIAMGNLHIALIVIGWMACALPSPADFAIVWNPSEIHA